MAKISTALCNASGDVANSLIQAGIYESLVGIMCKLFDKNERAQSATLNAIATFLARGHQDAELVRIFASSGCYPLALEHGFPSKALAVARSSIKSVAAAAAIDANALRRRFAEKNGMYKLVSAMDRFVDDDMLFTHSAELAAFLGNTKEGASNAISAGMAKALRTGLIYYGGEFEKSFLASCKALHAIAAYKPCRRAIRSLGVLRELKSAASQQSGSSNENIHTWSKMAVKQLERPTKL